MTNSVLEDYVGKLVRVKFLNANEGYDGIIRKTDECLFTLHPYRVYLPDYPIFATINYIRELRRQRGKDNIGRNERSITINSRQILSIEKIVGKWE